MRVKCPGQRTAHFIPGGRRRRWAPGSGCGGRGCRSPLVVGGWRGGGGTWGAAVVPPLLHAPVCERLGLGAPGGRCHGRGSSPVVHRHGDELVHEHAPGVGDLHQGEQQPHQHLVPAAQSLFVPLFEHFRIRFKWPQQHFSFLNSIVLCCPTCLEIHRNTFIVTS